ncbi:phosphoserine phosphatase SerB [Thalassotalea fusca]
MSLSGIAIPSSVFGTRSLAQIVTAKHTELPINCSVSASELLISSKTVLAFTPEEIDTLAQRSMPELVQAKEQGLLELVVFSTITLKQLLECVESANLTCEALTAINERNNLTSYRFQVTTNDIKQSRQAIAQYSQTQRLELALLDNAPSLSQPGILVMDMDSTTIEIECIDEIAALAGVGEEVAEVTELAMQGQLDFAQSLHQRVATLSGAPESILKQVADNIPLMPGLKELITTLQHHDWKIAIASGGFTYFADYLKSMLSLDEARANTLEIVDGKLTGKVLGDVVDAQVKADTLRQLQQAYNLPFTQTVAMGDGANDLIMMNAANLGVAFHAKPIVMQQAACAINHTGLDTLIHWLK